MKTFTLILWILLAFSMQKISAQNAPVTTAPIITSCPGALLGIPVTASGFNNIGALSLTLNYNAAALSYQSFTNNSGFPGLTINGSIPGKIIAGGYLAPGGSGKTLDDNAVLFTLYFNNLGGSTDLTWYDNGYSCEYADYHDYNPLNDNPSSTYYINGSVVSPQITHAPVTTVPIITVCPGTLLDIPVTVSDFCNIGALSLTLNYNATALSYQSSTNNSGFPGLAVNGSIPGKIIAGGYCAPGGPGISLANNSVLFTITFYSSGGASVLSWFDDGGSCEYTNNLFIPLNDSPSSSYYIDGSVETSQTGNAPVTTVPILTACPGTLIDIPVTVADFCNIGALSLTLNYNAAALSFQSFTNNSGFPGLTVNGSIPGKIIAGGYCAPGGPGVSLAGNAVLFTLTFYYSGGASVLSWFDDGGSCEYTDNLFNPLNDSPLEDYYIDGSVDEYLNFELKLFLEGAFQNGEMTTDLNDQNLIPLSQPFSGSPWNYAGSESVTEIPDNAVDWVLLDIRETTGGAPTATSDKSIAKKAVFLMKDGTIKDLNGTQDPDFVLCLNDHLYIAVFHRNHLSVISAISPPIIDGNCTYDFSLDKNRVLGGSMGYKEIAPGIWGMAAGDSNGDGNINDTDRQNNWNATAGVRGYTSFDFSMDSQLDNKDKNELWYPNREFHSQVPY